MGEAVRLFAHAAAGAVDVDEVLVQWNLDPLRRRPFAALSGGQRQRLFLALALLGDPEVVFLDELTTGLDPHAPRSTWELVRQVRDRGATVCLVAHFMEEAEALCDRVAVVDRGRVVVMDTPAALTAIRGGAIRMTFSARNGDLGFLSAVPGVERVIRDAGTVTVLGTAASTVPVAATLASRGVTPVDFRTHYPTLEDVFLSVTGRSMRDGTKGSPHDQPPHLDRDQAAAREPLNLVMSLLFPVVLMVLLVGSFGTEPSPDFGSVSGVDFYVPVYAAAIVAAMGFLGLPTHVAAYRETGVFRRFRAAGIPAVTTLSSQAAVMALLVAVGSAVMLALGFGIYRLSAPESPVGMVVALAVGTIAFAAIGALLGTLLPTARAAQGLGLALFFGLFFIAGGGPPLAVLPDPINTAIDYTPMGPLVDAISSPWHGSGWDGTALAALAAVGAGAAGLTRWRLSGTD